MNYGVFFLVALAIGGVLWVFVYPFLSGERKTERRVANVARTEPVKRQTRGNAPKARRDIEGTLKEIEERSKEKRRIPLPIRIEQAGLTWSNRKFFVISGVLGLVAFVLALFLGLGLLTGLGFAFAGAFGIPRWLLSFLKKRRETKFLNNFPDAVDVIVRGIKAGLPLLDSIKLIASESEEPIRSEFRGIIETQTIGIPLGDACQKLYERMPVAEANFFGIVISIQQKAGGNLSETLGNLSKVLRDRKKMKAKIKAMSMEAKASAAIIACLPPSVMTLVWLTSPAYIELLWTSSTGRVMLACCAVWMSIGVFVMKKMINFDF
jgi:tight adherence protein B